MRRKLIALPPTFLAVVLMAPGACGQSSKSNADDFQGVQKDVANAVFDFRDAVAKRDESKICDSYFTSELRDEVARVGKEAGRGSTCAKAIEDSIQGIDATDIAIVKNGITVSGDSATVKIKTTLSSCNDVQDTLELANQRGWRISKLPASGSRKTGC